jgi:hypothetical protein
MNEPPKWAIFDKNGPYIDGHDFGLLTTTGNINRFCARYRAAKSLESMTLDGFSRDTNAGYLSLTKLFYAYSAFEYFLQAIGVKQKKAKALLTKYRVSDWITEIKTRDVDDTFFIFVMGFVNASHKHHIGEYIKGNDFNFTYLPSGVRHTFAHGILTPNAGKCPVNQTIEICEKLYEILFIIMDTEFSERMDELHRIVST